MEQNKYLKLLHLAAALALFCFIFNLIQFFSFQLDDAFISLRYAQKLSTGWGLVFNNGERVEGYTNFLWVIIAAGIFKLGLAPSVILKCLSLLSALAVLWLVHRLEKLNSGPSTEEKSTLLKRTGWAIFFLLPLQAFAYWSVSAMETMFFTALLLGALLAAWQETQQDKNYWSALLFVLLSLTRPEGLALALGTYVLLALLNAKQINRRRHLVNVVLLLVPVGLYFAWRYHYYQALLPNTFYAKVTGSAQQLQAGLKHIKEWLFGFPVVAGGLLLTLPAFKKFFNQRQTSPAIFLTLFILGYLLYLVLIGGDNLPQFRFYLPLVPLGIVLLVWLLRDRGGQLGQEKSTLLLLALLVATWFFNIITGEREKAFVADRTAKIGQRVGTLLAQQLPGDQVIAVNTAGAIPFFAGHQTIDMLGLTDAKIARRPVYVTSDNFEAHRRGWGDYVLQKRPRLIFFYNTAGSRAPFYLSDRELVDNPWFRFFYLLRTLPAPASSPSSSPQSVATFWGFPFGRSPTGRLLLPDMGLRAEFQSGFISQTVLYESEAVINFFEFDSRLLSFWPLFEKYAHKKNTDFVDEIAAIWQQEKDKNSLTSVDEKAKVKAEVEALCQQAFLALRQGQILEAKKILVHAQNKNSVARSPLPAQYLANIAMQEGDVWLAIYAQREALRLDPTNQLYLHNFKAVLSMPYETARRPLKAATEMPPTTAAQVPSSQPALRFRLP